MIPTLVGVIARTSMTLWSTKKKKKSIHRNVFKEKHNKSGVLAAIPQKIGLLFFIAAETTKYTSVTHKEKKTLLLLQIPVYMKYSSLNEVICEWVSFSPFL
jgi:hypothetical protein